jgi:hypothetical protein
VGGARGTMPNAKNVGWKVKRPLGGHRRRWEDNIKVHLKNMGGRV